MTGEEGGVGSHVPATFRYKVACASNAVTLLQGSSVLEVAAMTILLEQNLGTRACEGTRLQHEGSTGMQPRPTLCSPTGLECRALLTAYSRSKGRTNRFTYEWET